MNTILDWLRKILAAPLAAVATTLLVAGASVGTLVFTVLDPDSAKNWLADAKVYEQVVDVGVDLLLAKVSVQVTDNDLFRGLTSEEKIRAELKQVLPSDWLKIQAEALIDSAYAYLGGSAKTLDLSIDFGSREGAAQKALGNVFKSKVASLPRCGAGTPGSLQNFNLFQAQCLPRSINVAEANALIDSQVTKLKPLENAGATTLQLGGGQNLAEHLGPIQRMAVAAGRGIWALLVLPVVFLALLFWLWPGKEKKLGAVGRVFISAGFTVGAGSLLGRIFTGNFLDDLMQKVSLPMSERAENAILALYNTVSNDIVTKLIIVGASLLAVGAVLKFMPKTNLVYRAANAVFIIGFIGSIAVLASVFNEVKSLGLFS